VLGLRRVWVFGATAWLAAACGDKFVVATQGAGGTAAHTPSAGAAGEGDEDVADAGGSASGESSGGDTAQGGATGGKGGAPAMGGASSGSGNVGGGGIGGIGVGGGVVGVGGNPVTMSPVPTTGLELWFDASSGITEESGGVSLWKDRSGNARHAKQGNDAWRPQLAKSGLNGKPTVLFDGKDDFLQLPEIPGDFSQGLSIFVVGQQDGESNCSAFFDAANGPEVEDIDFGLWQNRYLYEVGEPFLSITDVDVALAAPLSLSAVHRVDHTLQFRRNAHSIGSSSDLPLPPAKTRNNVFLGGTSYNDCGTLPGRISEVLVYSRGVTDKEIATIESYQQQKWACCEQ